MRHTVALLIAAGLTLGAAAGTGPVAGPATTRSFADFRPSKHGFSFVNSFEGSPIAIAGIEVRGFGPSSYGICGGMSAAAADLYLAGRPIPMRADAPRRPEPLFTFLSRRQMDSLGEGMAQAARFSRWMGYSDDSSGGTMALSLGELSAIIAGLDAGRGVPVGLVLVNRGGEHRGASRRGAVWDNHQVLAFAAARGQGGAGTVDVRIYDPNHPGNDGVVLRFEPVIVGHELSALGLSVPVLGVKTRLVVSAKRTSPVRGIFAMPYSPARPPENLK